MANSVAVRIPKLLPPDVYPAEPGWTEIYVIRMGSENTSYQALERLVNVRTVVLRKTQKRLENMTPGKSL